MHYIGSIKKPRNVERNESQIIMKRPRCLFGIETGRESGVEGNKVMKERRETKVLLVLTLLLFESHASSRTLEGSKSFPSSKPTSPSS